MTVSEIRPGEQVKDVHLDEDTFIDENTTQGPSVLTGTTT
jgi:hypothetical protein